MNITSAKEELESFGSIKFYYESMRKSFKSYHSSFQSVSDKEQQELERLENAMNEAGKQLSLKIEKIISPFNALLYHRYILLMKPHELCIKFSYSTQHIRRLLERGIELYANQY